MNGSSSSLYAALADGFDIEPPQKTKPNRQYSHYQPFVALVNCRKMFSLLLYFLHCKDYARHMQSLVARLDHSVFSIRVAIYVCTLIGQSKLNILTMHE